MESFNVFSPPFDCFLFYIFKQVLSFFNILGEYPKTHEAPEMFCRPQKHT